eukprot:15451668-Alexandrium_andersonii.AAC.1
MAMDYRGLRIGGLRIGACELAASRPRTLRGPLSWADLESARTTAQNASLGSLRDRIGGLSWVRAVQAPKA